MTQPINHVLSNWLDKKMSKQAGIGQSLLNVGKAAVKPSNLWKGVKYAPSAALLGVLGETGVRTANNALHGNLSVGEPRVSEHIIGGLANVAATATGFRPFIRNTAQAAVEGLDLSPKAQKILDAASNITNPNVRHQIYSDTSTAINQAATDVAQNVGNVAGNTVGRSLGHGLAGGMLDDMLHHPFLTLGGAVTFGAGPAIAYDAATYKRRKEEAERNKAIMRYILKQEGQTKMGGVIDILKNTSRAMSEEFKPTAESLKDLSSKYIYRPSSADPAKLMDLLSKYNGKPIPNSLLDKAKTYPQTLFNNSITRHPVKSFLGGSVINGTAVTAAQNYSQDPKYNNLTNTRGHIMKNWAHNMTLAPEAAIKGLELGAVSNIEMNHGPTWDKLQQIKANVHGQPGPIPPPNDPHYMPEHFELSPKTEDYLKNGNIVGTTPAESKPQGNWKDVLPYAVVGGLAGLPFPAYSIYRKYANKKLNKLDDENVKLQQRTQRANVKSEA